MLMTFSFSGCIVDRISPFTETSDISPRTEGERRLWRQADDLVEAVKKSHQMYRGKRLKDYAQSIMDKLYPEFKGSFNVHIMKAPVANAFALPNGSIFYAQVLSPPWIMRPSWQPFFLMKAFIFYGNMAPYVGKWSVMSAVRPSLFPFSAI